MVFRAIKNYLSSQFEPYWTDDFANFNDGNNPVYTPRISPLDGLMLDEELIRMLLDPLEQSAGQTNASEFQSSWYFTFKPEIYSLLKLMLIHGVLFGRARPGDKLEQLKPMRLTCEDKYQRISRRIAIYYITLEVIIPWIFKRINLYMSSKRWIEKPEGSFQYKIWNALQNLEKVYYAANLINFVSFLLNSKYRSITDRILGIEMIPSKKNLIRVLDLEYINQELLWKNYTDFFITFLPLLPIQKIKGYSLRLFNSNLNNKNHTDILKLLPDNICAFCLLRNDKHVKLLKQAAKADLKTKYGLEDLLDYKWPTELPKCSVPYYNENCSHIFCYYCIAQAKQLGQSCPICFKSIEKICPYGLLVS